MGVYTDRFKVNDQVCVVTGGGGLLGQKHAEAILEGGGIPVLLDISEKALSHAKIALTERYPEATIETFLVDITQKSKLEEVRDVLLQKYGRVDVLINNAANNPKVEDGRKNLAGNRFQDFPLEKWNQDFAIGLTGAFLCSQIFGEVMEKFENGVILNISSDYGIISPDQRIYWKENIPEEEQSIKPVSYSIIKHGLIGLTKYLGTYWAKKGIRVNTLCPASLYNNQDEEFVKKISQLIPMGRMSKPDEYVCTVLYMISDASTYMTGATVILDGGRTVW